MGTIAIRRAACGLLLVLPSLGAQAEESTGSRFHVPVQGVRGRTVTLVYDFRDSEQLLDFEEVHPPHLGPETTKKKALVEKGHLLLDGTIALRHRAASTGHLRAVIDAHVVLRGDMGAFVAGPEPEEPYLLLNLFDRGLKREGGLLLARCESAGPRLPVIWKEIAGAPAEEVEKRIRGDAPFDLEIFARGPRMEARLGTLYRSRDTVAPPDPLQMGLWVREAALSVDRLLLEFEMADAPAIVDPATKDLPIGTLARTVLDAPLSDDAAAARKELSRRGPDGWKKLDGIIRTLARDKAYAAVPVVAALGEGEEPERLGMLAKLLSRTKPPEIRLAILMALAPYYPERAELFHGGLRDRLPGRRDLLRALIPRGLADDVLQQCCEDPEIGGEAYEALRDRGVGLEAAALGNLPKTRAKEGLSAAASRSFLKEFTTSPNWKLIEALIGLLDDSDPEVSRGAYLLLLTVSGKDIAPVKDLWTSWRTAKADSYVPPDFGDPGVVTAALLRGREFLRSDLAEDGKCVWPQNFEWPGCIVGATSLAVYALRASGVPADDPAIQRAVRETLLDHGQALRGDLEGYTYALSLLAMALEAVDKEAYRVPLTALARRLAEGQLDNGQWTYYCRERDYARRPGAGDNSNTQYAMLGLRSARRAGVEVPREVWEKNERFWRENQNGNGGWGYGPRGTYDHELSMTSAGVATLGICAEALSGLKAWDVVRESKNVGAGMVRLGEILIEKHYDGAEIYAFYGVERASVLTGIRAFDDFDWYREGAALLVNSQQESGAWGRKNARGIAEGQGYGEAIDTAYALLFLKRATTGLPGADGGGVVKIPNAAQLKKKRESLGK